jgi:ribosomal protein S7
MLIFVYSKISNLKSRPFNIDPTVRIDMMIAWMFEICDRKSKSMSMHCVSNELKSC